MLFIYIIYILENKVHLEQKYIFKFQSFCTNPFCWILMKVLTYFPKQPHAYQVQLRLLHLRSRRLFK